MKVFLYLQIILFVFFLSDVLQSGWSASTQYIHKNYQFLNEGICRIFGLTGQFATHATQHNNVKGDMSASTVPNSCFGGRVLLLSRNATEFHC